MPDDDGVAAARSEGVSDVGRIAARIDRLPLTWVQWRLALITRSSGA